MKRLVLFFTALFILAASNLNAAEWSSKEGLTYILNKEYQIEAIVNICIDRYKDENMALQCAQNHTMAYADVVTSMLYTMEVDKDGFDVSKPVNCIESAMNAYWIEKYNIANWILVQKYINQCMEQ